jgi:molecular chaperone DnaK
VRPSVGGGYHRGVHLLVRDEREEDANVGRASPCHGPQLQQTRQFHVTKQREVWPIILGAGVAYLGLKFFNNYYEAKEKGALKKAPEEKKKPKKSRGPTTEDLWGSAEFGKISGIMGLDTGTLFSRVSVGSEKGAKVVENAEGARGTPSIVGVQGDEFLVGTQAETLPHIYAPQQLVGRKFDEESATAFIEDMGYEDYVKKGIGGSMQLIVGDSGVSSSAEMLTAQLISHMKGVASANVESGKCSHAFLALPAEAAVSPGVHQAMQIAAEQANLKLLGAAQAPLCGLIGALASSGDLGDEGLGESSVVVLCDVGRSTDIAVMRVDEVCGEHGIEGIGPIPYEEDHVEVLHMASEPFVGGRLFDKSVIDWLVHDFERQNKIDLTTDEMTMMRVRNAAQSARLELSSKIQSEINEPFITADATGPKHLIATLPRSKLEMLCRGDADKIVAMCNRAVEAAGLSAEELDSAHLVILGGMARMPMVVEEVRKAMKAKGGENMKYMQLDQPEEMVALGAGIKGAVKATIAAAAGGD